MTDEIDVDGTTVRTGDIVRFEILSWEAVTGGGAPVGEIVEEEVLGVSAGIRGLPVGASIKTESYPRNGVQVDKIDLIEVA